MINQPYGRGAAGVIEDRPILSHMKGKTNMSYKGQRSKSRHMNLLEVMELAKLSPIVGKVTFSAHGGSARQRRTIIRRCHASLHELERVRDHEHSVEGWIYDVIVANTKGSSK